MVYNHAKEESQWKKWKEQEERLLRSLNVDEDIIMELRKYDWNAFKLERRIREKQNLTDNIFFYNLPYYDKKEICSVEDLLNDIEDESLLHYLYQTDKTTLTIILLKILGYSTKDISEILKIKSSTIYMKIHRLKNKLKNM
ncbi:sigma-70 family RNA polymerase sigma factor [Clostridium sp. C1]|uniref:helix-turn-helix transcriptional regulator n=1 Tax=Clostridium sp. C1 TaxID=1155388 RepID=UPI001BABF44F|nr:sigma-70 family RNA polymerase sigma factor [Clostridium sp. C1]QUN13163.1 sigma-70 family RNA polymerase sigma factor [Clostridium sp. C1]